MGKSSSKCCYDADSEWNILVSAANFLVSCQILTITSQGLTAFQTYFTPFLCLFQAVYVLQLSILLPICDDRDDNRLLRDVENSNLA